MSEPIGFGLAFLFAILALLHSRNARKAQENCDKAIQAGRDALKVCDAWKDTSDKLIKAFDQSLETSEKWRTLYLEAVAELGKHVSPARK